VQGVSQNPGEHQGLRYAPGLDGVRALAVFAVVAYHIGTTSSADVLRGGYLGVDVFFVLSGYLITSLLVVEAQRNGSISIKNFYIRRARRLLPALFALLLVVTAVGAFWLPGQAAQLKGDVLASLGYFQNWWLIIQSSSYFGTAGDRPPMLTHLWSLAVEEQYYLVWPLVLIFFAKIRAARPVMLFFVLAGVAASTYVGLRLFVPFADPSRVYYGTDTRALAPLLGAALAIAVRPWLHRTRLPGGTRRALDTLGVIALLGLAGIAASLGDQDDRLYQGGFLVIAALAAVVVGVAGHPDTGLGRALGTQPLRYLGERSYAIYLWHWPVCLVTRPGVDVPVTGWANGALRVGIAIVLAEISYQLIEKPIRRHGFIATLRRPRPAKAAARHPAAVPSGGHPTVEPAVGRASVPSVRPAAIGRPPRPAQRRPRAPLIRTAVLTIVLIGGGTWAGLGLTSAAEQPVAGGPIDTGPEQTLGPLPGTTGTEAGPVTSAPPHVSLPLGSRVAFFGDSQGDGLLRNQPTDLGNYIDAVDATIEGCGILLGRMESRSGERRNLTSSCGNWRSTWVDRVHQYDPDLSVIMIGAWDVFDIIVDGTGERVPFGSPKWDQIFNDALDQAISALRGGKQPVALALLPCYRPVEANKGRGAGYWPERGEDDRTRHVNDLLRAAADSYRSGVYTLEPPGVFCTDESIAQDLSYRWDGIHFARKGAALYFQTILPHILDPASSQ